MQMLDAAMVLVVVLARCLQLSGSREGPQTGPGLGYERPVVLVDSNVYYMLPNSVLPIIQLAAAYIMDNC